MYCPALGESADGRCGCGAPATTEVQVGWHQGRDGRPSGGQYQEICEACYVNDGHAEEEATRAGRRTY